MIRIDLLDRVIAGTALYSCNAACFGRLGPSSSPDVWPSLCSRPQMCGRPSAVVHRHVHGDVCLGACMQAGASATTLSVAVLIVTTVLLSAVVVLVVSMLMSLHGGEGAGKWGCWRMGPSLAEVRARADSASTCVHVHTCV